MLLTLTTTRRPATDLGFLLHKHPDRAQSFELSVGTAHVVYPEATDERCTAALLLEVDPVGLVRGTGGRGKDRGGFSLAEYVNDRPYAASSMLAVALGRVYRSALAGRCDARPELVDQAIPLEVHAPAVPCRGGSRLAEEMFAPLGWTVRAEPVPLDQHVPTWGDSRYVDLRLTGTLRLADALSHLYVLLPVLDADKHYWVGEDEVAKLLRAGEGWLAGHPHRERIAQRYLAGSRRLADSAIARLAEVDDVATEVLDDAVPEPDVSVPSDADDATTAAVTAEAPSAASDPPAPSLRDQRLTAVLDVLRTAGAHSVVDLGCGEGALVRALLDEPTVDRVLGTDVSHRALQIAGRRLHLDTMPEARRRRVDLVQSSLTYVDERIAGFDAAVLMEVIEHVDPSRLPALERSVLGRARPGVVVVTTPNAEHNVRWETLPSGHLRHHDHRFEWTRAEFRAWAQAAAAAHGYTVTFRPVGPDDPEVGPPTQMAVLGREEVTA